MIKEIQPGFAIDPDKREVYTVTGRKELPAMEWKLLVLLATTDQRGGLTMKGGIESLWDIRRAGRVHEIRFRTLIRRLRERLGEGYIETVHGGSYRFVRKEK